jgi:hypothetical protein
MTVIRMMILFMNGILLTEIRNSHDGQTFGSQNIKDKLLSLELTTDFVKLPSGEHGGDWVLRVTGMLKSDNPVSLVFYAGSESPESGVMNKKNRIVGKTPDLGEFSITWREKEQNHNAEIRSLNIPSGMLWMIKPYAQKFIMENAQKLRKDADFKAKYGLGLRSESADIVHSVLLYQAVFEKDFQVCNSSEAITRAKRELL